MCNRFIVVALFIDLTDEFHFCYTAINGMEHAIFGCMIPASFKCKILQMNKFCGYF